MLKQCVLSVRQVCAGAYHGYFRPTINIGAGPAYAKLIYKGDSDMLNDYILSIIMLPPSITGQVTYGLSDGGTTGAYGYVGKGRYTPPGRSSLLVHSCVHCGAWSIITHLT